MHSTNYFNAFIAVAEDCRAQTAEVPPKPGTVAAMQYDMLVTSPYSLTSDELLFAVHAKRKALDAGDLTAARDAFFSKPQACLRASPLVKIYGWGLHHDDKGRVALIGRETEAYSRLAADTSLEQRSGMRSRRA